MSNRSLFFELDEPSATYAAGAPIRGVVGVVVESDTRCDDLVVELGWRTHGRGNVDKATAEKLSLGGHAWTPGQEYRYRFELAAPASPLTHRGTLVNVDWYLAARADVPWARDPKCEAEIVVVPAAPKEPARLARGYRTAPVAEAHRRAPPGSQSGKGLGEGAQAAIGVAFGLLFSGVGAVVLLGGLGAYSPRGDASLPAVAFGGIFAFVGGLFVFLSLRKALAQQKLGRPEVTLEPDPAAPGDSLRLSLTLRPNADASISGISLVLEGKEIATSGSGTNKTTHKHSLHHHVERLGPVALRARQSHSFEQRFTLPSDAAFTFGAPSNEVRWWVEIHVEIDAWPDWVHEQPLAVVPP